MEIVGLKNFVDDDVNKLIAKFVGFKPHPLTKMLKPIFNLYLKLDYEDDFEPVKLLFFRTHCYDCSVTLSEDELKGNYGQEISYFKLCSECYECEYFCERCHQALTNGEREIDMRPVLCDSCFEHENETEEENDD